jgi:CheY-like chemotaxis protein
MLMNEHEEGQYDVFAEHARKKQSVLLVDSDEEGLRYTSTLLRRLDYKTETAKTAREGYVCATTDVPSVIITALKLKDMNGLNLMTQLRRNSKTTTIPFIALRTSGDAIAEKYCFSAGAVDCLVKPVSAELLYRAVQGCLEDRPRASMRFRTTQLVWVDTVPFDNSDDVHTLDISERGLFLRTTKAVPENTQLSLRIDLAGTIIKAKARVVYTCPPCKGPYQEPGMGLQFTYLSPTDLEFVRRFMRTEITRGLLNDEQDEEFFFLRH